MSKCPECQEQEMEVIGTEKFGTGEPNNFAVKGIGYTIMTVNYCKKCNVMVLREPKKIYG